MLPASNRGVGMNLGFPDVCLTPAGPVVVPVPYPNIAMHAMAAPFAATVLVTSMNALNQGSIIPMTMGDEPGVAHPTIKGPGTFTMGNPTVMIEGLPAINLLCPTTGNNMNDGLGAVVVPDAVNVFYTYARATPDDLEAHRAPLAGDVVEGELDPREGRVAVLRIRGFAPHVAARVFDALRALRADGVVLDLRGCPGGELAACIELASDFLGDGDVVLQLVDVEGDVALHRARGEALHDQPLAIVVDGATASAAEALAGSLQAHGRARLFGERTYGKASVQTFEEGGARYATVARWTLPNGVDIDGVGLRVDVEGSGADALEAAIAAVAGGAARR